MTSVPLQQLFVLNSEFMARQAQALAARVTEGPETDDAARIRRAILLVYGRPAREPEVQLGVRFLAAAAATAETQRAAPAPLAWEKYAQVLLSANEFAFVD